MKGLQERPTTAANGFALVAVVLGGLAGQAAGQGLGVHVAAFLAGVAIWLVCLNDWRRGALLLVTYLPFSGLLGIAFFGRALVGPVVLDLALIAPVTLACLMRGGAPGRTPAVPRRVVLLLGILAATVFLLSFSALIPNALVAIIGARGWLYFLLLLPVGVAIGSEADLTRRFLRVAVIAGIPGVLVGIAEAALLAAGKSAFVYGLYGPAAPGAFAGYGSFDIGKGNLYRLSGLFPFVAAYFAFTLAMCVLSYALWRTGRNHRERNLGLLVFSLSVAASLTSGTRSAFLLVPALVVILLVFDGRRLRPRDVLLGVAGFSCVPLILGISPSQLPAYLLNVSSQESGDLLGEGFRTAARLTRVGLGTGMDTNAARNVVPGNLFSVIGGWQESYYVKAWIELGVFGLAVVVALMLSLILSLAAAARACRTSDRSLVAACAAYVLLIALYSAKGAVLDQAPAGVYFWLLTGLAFGVARRVREGAPMPSAA